MQEIKNYDRAANKFYDTLDIKSLPINSWDLYATFFDKICQSINDVFVLKNLAKSNLWSYREDFNEELLQKEHVVVVTDAELRIVYATQNIRLMNGYRPEEILGKKPKMFQGIKTCKETSRNIGIAIKNREPFEAVVLNYRKDGSTYNCWIKGEPILNKSGEVVNFIAYEKEVA
ncbi:PAS domain-containing protein [Maribacter algarum]|uniref:PAS domain-containing protein n=1 Tax=Maribacter algarum (ex Zhang et al. 2020) TaxID=2578118 RepID=A0A5S3PW91_9FLAO|nr:PAS domain-containing protein [Maribacter algarum]TMM59158.1 PAS domain-containing protein [Maribacter algarum]